MLLRKRIYCRVARQDDHRQNLGEDDAQPQLGGDDGPPAGNTRSKKKCVRCCCLSHHHLALHGRNTMQQPCVLPLAIDVSMSPRLASYYSSQWEPQNSREEQGFEKLIMSHGVKL